MQKKHKDYENNCLICTARYLPDLYTVHINEVHGDDIIENSKVTICLKCKTPNLDSEFKSHVLTCKQDTFDKYQCKKCNSILDANGLIIHYSTVNCSVQNEFIDRTEPLTDEEYKDLTTLFTRNRNEILTPINGQSKFDKLKKKR